MHSVIFPVYIELADPAAQGWICNVYSCPISRLRAASAMHAYVSVTVDGFKHTDDNLVT